MNECDWHILAGNDERINSDCLNWTKRQFLFGGGVGRNYFLRNQHLKPKLWGVSSQPLSGLCSFCFFELNNPFKIYFGTTLLEPTAWNIPNTASNIENKSTWCNRIFLERGIRSIIVEDTSAFRKIPLKTEIKFFPRLTLFKWNRRIKLK